jgi:hypothetical protein
MTRAILCLLCGTLTGCAVLSVQPYKNVEEAAAFCVGMADNAASISSEWTALGLASAFLASGFFVAGTVMGPDEDPKATWVEKNRATLSSAYLGGSLAALAVYAYSRADAASEAAAGFAGATPSLEGTKAEEGRRAWEECRDVWARWVGGRSNTAKPVVDP